MTCAGFEERIARFVGGDLAADDATAVGQHLRVCAACAELARELEEDRAWLASRPPETADVDFAAMRREIRREIARPRWGWKWIAVAAAILIVVGVAVSRRAPVERPLPLVAARKEVAGRKEVAERTPTLSRDREAAVLRRPVRAPSRVSATRGARADVGVRPTKLEPEPPVEIRIATRDPNVTIILLHEFKGELE